MRGYLTTNWGPIGRTLHPLLLHPLLSLPPLTLSSLGDNRSHFASVPPLTLSSLGPIGRTLHPLLSLPPLSLSSLGANGSHFASVALVASFVSQLFVFVSINRSLKEQYTQYCLGKIARATDG
jgi:hypothetical protein